MKKLLLILCIFVLSACAGLQTARVIPPDPIYQEVQIMPVRGGILIDDENAQKLLANVQAMKAHNDALKKLLNDGRN